MSSHVITIERLLEADCETVFAAWTDPAIMAKWFFVADDWQASAQTQIEVGGAFRLRMTVPTGEVHTMTGEYREIVRPRRLVFTWNSHVATETVVTIDLEPIGDQTRLRLTHELLPSDDARDAHAAGWHGCLSQLARVLVVLA